MQEIRAIIRPTKLESLRTALRTLPHFPGMSICSVEGFTAPKLIDKQSDADELRDYSAKVMIYIIADNDMVQTIVQTIVQHGNTGLTGDGLIWTTPITSLIKIKSGATAVWQSPS